MKGVARTQSLVALVWLTVVARPVWAEYPSGGGMVGSPHDFTNPVGNVYQADQHATVCIFCHSTTDSPGTDASTELSWNHRLSAQNFFWSDSAQTEGGTPLPTNLATWAGSSKYCLSCHDGTVSVGDVYQGSYPVISFAGGAPYADGSGTVPTWVSTRVAPKWAGNSGIVDPMGKLTAGPCTVGESGDLRGTHPVGIPYPYQGAPGTYNGITTGPAVDLRDYVAVPANVKLFTAVGNDVIAGAQAGAAGIECATCHDVHNEAAQGRYLLRDTERQLCLDCHNL